MTTSSFRGTLAGLSCATTNEICSAERCRADEVGATFQLAANLPETPATPQAAADKCLLQFRAIGGESAHSGYVFPPYSRRERQPHLYDHHLDKQPGRRP